MNGVVLERVICMSLILASHAQGLTSCNDVEYQVEEPKPFRFREMFPHYLRQLQVTFGASPPVVDFGNKLEWDLIDTERIPYCGPSNTDWNITFSHYLTEKLDFKPGKLVRVPGLIVDLAMYDAQDAIFNDGVAKVNNEARGNQNKVIKLSMRPPKLTAEAKLRDKSNKPGVDETTDPRLECVPVSATAIRKKISSLYSPENQHLCAKINMMVAIKFSNEFMMKRRRKPNETVPAADDRSELIKLLDNHKIWMIRLIREDREAKADTEDEADSREDREAKADTEDEADSLRTETLFNQIIQETSKANLQRLMQIDPLREIVDEKIQEPESDPYPDDGRPYSYRFKDVYKPLGFKSIYILIELTQILPKSILVDVFNHFRCPRP